MDITRAFHFDSIAIVGATERISYMTSTVKGLRTVGFPGAIYPVNPTRDTIWELPCFPSLQALPQPPGAVVVGVRRDLVPGVVQECLDCGAGIISLVTSGFAEAGAEGRQLQEQLAAQVRGKGVPMFGPNCVGAANLYTRRSFFGGTIPAGLRPGNVAVVSGSGGLLNEVLSFSAYRGLKLSLFAHTGNEAVVCAADVLEHGLGDANTEVLLAILEAIRSPGHFLRMAEGALQQRKPLLAIKIGRSEKGRGGALTHTGSLAGDDKINDAVLRQKGVIRLEDIDELVEAGLAFSAAAPIFQRGVPLERAAIIEISGGGKGMISDTAHSAGLPLAVLEPATVAALQQVMVPGAPCDNPLDITLGWETPAMERIFPAVLRILAGDPGVDIIVTRLTVPMAGPVAGVRTRLAEIRQCQNEHPNRLFAALSRASEALSAEWRQALAEFDIPYLQGYGRGMRALGHVARYSREMRHRGLLEASGS